MTDTLTIRPAVEADAALILTLLEELAEYEKLTDKFHMSEDAIARDFFGAAPAVHCDLAFASDGAVGLATWYWIYTTFGVGRGIYLEDIYVRERWRGHGYGKALMAHLAGHARARGGTHIKWAVLNWNKPSIAFYEGIGAKPESDWSVYRLEGAALKKLAGA